MPISGFKAWWKPTFWSCPLYPRVIPSMRERKSVLLINVTSVRAWLPLLWLLFEQVNLPYQQSVKHWLKKSNLFQYIEWKSVRARNYWSDMAQLKSSRACFPLSDSSGWRIYLRFALRKSKPPATLVADTVARICCLEHSWIFRHPRCDQMPCHSFNGECQWLMSQWRTKFHFRMKNGICRRREFGMNAEEVRR